MTVFCHNSLSLSFGDPTAGSRVTVISHLQNQPNACMCVCLCLHRVHDASVSIWQRAEQEVARWGAVYAVLSSSPPPRSLAPDLDCLLIPGGKDILDFEDTGIALWFWLALLLSAECACLGVWPVRRPSDGQWGRIGGPTRGSARWLPGAHWAEWRRALGRQLYPAPASTLPLSLCFLSIHYCGHLFYQLPCSLPVKTSALWQQITCEFSFLSAVVISLRCVSCLTPHSRGSLLENTRDLVALC